MLPLFDLSLRLNGYPIQEADAELRKIAALSAKEYLLFLEDKEKSNCCLSSRKQFFL